MLAECRTERPAAAAIDPWADRRVCQQHIKLTFQEAGSSSFARQTAQPSFSSEVLTREHWLSPQTWQHCWQAKGNLSHGQFCKDGRHHPSRNARQRPSGSAAVECQPESLPPQARAPFQRFPQCHALGHVRSLAHPRGTQLSDGFVPIVSSTQPATAQDQQFSLSPFFCFKERANGLSLVV